MGKFRKATQLVHKLQELCAKQGSGEKLSQQEDTLMNMFFPQGVAVRYQAIAYYSRDDNSYGHGLEFIISNGNAAIRGHLKFHPKLQGERDFDRDNADMRTAHIVIESIKYRRQDKTLVEMKFQDSRSADGRAYQALHRYLEDNSVKGGFPGALQTIERIYKPRMDVYSYFDHGARRRLPASRYVGDHNGSSYQILRAESGKVSDAEALFAALDQLGRSFITIADISCNEKLFKENTDVTSDESVELNDRTVEDLVNDKHYTAVTPMIAYKPPGYVEPKLEINNDAFPALTGGAPTEVKTLV